MSKISKKSSEGVTLLIAILVLSIVMAVSFSLSTILLAESRNSGDLTRTEPALYGATSVTEEALYNVKRSTGEEHFSSTVGSTDIDTIATPLNDPVQKIKIPSNATTFSQNNPNVYALYNPDNPYGPSDYGEIKLTFLDTNTPGSKIHIYLCQWDPQNPPQNADGTYKNVCSDPNDISAPNYWAVRDFQISPGQTWDTLSDCGGCMNSSYQQELILYQSNGTPPSDLYAELETFDFKSYPKGIPYFGATAYSISATNADVNRNIKVIIPNGVKSFGSTVSTPGTIVLTTNTSGPDGSFPFTMRDVTNSADQSLPANYTAVVSGGTHTATKFWQVTAGDSYQISANLPPPSGWSSPYPSYTDCYNQTTHIHYAFPGAAGGFPVGSGETMSCTFNFTAVSTCTTNTYTFSTPVTNATWVVPATCCNATFSVWGAGGGGGSGTGNGQGGGGGGYSSVGPQAVTAGTTYYYTVGAGGVFVSSFPVGSGGQSCVGLSANSCNVVQANPGNNGYDGSVGSVPVGSGAGGTGNSRGNDGNYGVGDGSGGDGGSSGTGSSGGSGGPAAPFPPADGTRGSTPGGGGGGSGGNYSFFSTGGVGGDGTVEIDCH